MRSILLMMRTLAPGLTKSLLVGLTAASAFLFGGAPQSQHAEATLAGFTSFDAVGAGTTANALQGTAALGINASGQIVGIETDSASVHHGMVRAADGTITEFDAPGAGTSGNVGTYALGINASGMIAGFYSTASENHYHGYVRSAAGAITEFDVPASDPASISTNAFAINEGGDVTGFYTSPPPSSNPFDQGIYAHGFVRRADGDIATFDAPGAGTTANQGTRPVAINASGVITGFYRDSKNLFHGFIRDASANITSLDVPGAGTGTYQGTLATAIDTAGDIAGLDFDSKGTAHGFLRAANGTITSFDATAAGTGTLQGTFPLGMNSEGAIVGLYFDSNNLMHGFARSAGGTLTAIDAPGAGSGTGISASNAGIGEIAQSFQGTGALGINDSGEIAGTYLDANSVTHGYVLAAAPSFQVTATAVSISRGATAGNTSTITVTPGNFTGAVALTAAVTTSPSGAQDPPTLSFGPTTPVNITGTSSGTATLTISTTAASTARLTHPRLRKLEWYGAGGAVLASVLFFGVPGRRKGWTRLLSLLLFCAAIGGGMLGCSGSSANTGTTGTTNPGTTPGNYVVTVTGTSGATTASGTVALTVQ